MVNLFFHQEQYRKAQVIFMNIFTVSTGSHGAGSYQTKSIFAGSLPGLHNNMLKSAKDKMERQQKAGNEIAFWEKQKENLKQKECSSVEEIAEKLELLHNYEDEITAVKAAYNKEQMSHILDEAEEQGEKNAEAAKKLEPKTPEERQEEMVEEALGVEEDESILDEMLDETAESMEEVQRELQQTQEQMAEEITEKITEESAESMSEQLDLQKENIEENAQELQRLRSMSKRDYSAKMHQRFDMRV